MSSPKGLFFCLLVPIGVTVILRCYITWKKLAHIPGPPSAHFSILWLVRHAWNGNLFPTLAQIGEDYGRRPV